MKRQPKVPLLGRAKSLLAELDRELLQQVLGGYDPGPNPGGNQDSNGQGNEDPGGDHKPGWIPP